MFAHVDTVFCPAKFNYFPGYIGLKNTPIVGCNRSRMDAEISEGTGYLSASPVCGFGNVGKCTRTLCQGFQLMKINNRCTVTYLTGTK